MARVVFFAALFFAPAVHADEPVKIPLKDVWAYEMDGTKNIRDLDPDSNIKSSMPDDEQARRYKESPVLLLHSTFLRSEPQSPPKAFAVNTKTALSDAVNVLVEKKQPQSVFQNPEVSVFFFSYPFGAFVHLDEITRRGNFIEVRYKFVPHATKQVTSHFAIIPLGKLEPGDYNVDIVEQAPQSNKKWGDKLICQPFSFTIKK